MQMLKYDILLHRILPQTLPCPKSMALDALQTVAMDFCKETGIWQEKIQADVISGDHILSSGLPPTIKIVDVKRLYIDEAQLPADGYEVAGDEVILKSCPQSNGLALLEATLRPSRDSESFLEAIMEEWGDALVFGAIAKLKSMSGRHIEWSDANGANINNQLYQESLISAKGKKFRRKYNGILYVNSGLWEGD